MIENIYNNLFDTIAFDVEWNYDNLFKEFHHLSLFSICLQFLRCQRSCEKNCANYCRMCSRVRDNIFYDYNAFLSLKVSDMDGYLNISNSGRVDFDVFLSQPAYFPYAFCESSRKCTQHQVFNYVHDLLAAFCSFLIRMYMNIGTKYFSNLMYRLSFADEKNVIKKILTGATLLLDKFFDLIYDFFYEFFDLFSQVNVRDCFFMF